ncbi:hypothetical protein BGZ94_004998, partial [Podila epigama]
MEERSTLYDTCKHSTKHSTKQSTEHSTKHSTQRVGTDTVSCVRPRQIDKRDSNTNLEP